MDPVFEEYTSGGLSISHTHSLILYIQAFANTLTIDISHGQDSGSIPFFPQNRGIKQQFETALTFGRHILHWSRSNTEAL